MPIQPDFSQLLTMGVEFEDRIKRAERRSVFIFDQNLRNHDHDQEIEGCVADRLILRWLILIGER